MGYQKARQIFTLEKVIKASIRFKYMQDKIHDEIPLYRVHMNIITAEKDRCTNWDSIYGQKC